MGWQNEMMNYRNMKSLMIGVAATLLQCSSASAALDKVTIAFENPLPRYYCNGKKCGNYNDPEFSLPGVVTTSDHELGDFLQRMRETIMANRRLLFIDGKVIVCNHNWIRDHVH